ncbi:MAG: tRNA (adenosine(37)-N6)-threonylcarbamoyltransferase complex transferase subunit TsaD [Bacteroides sp.]|nr:tRNA (adenosine(37)-N6)-threonylcarbamoyltransferase complex transferase subunit TsaD [Bacillota bacterium]MCM1393541.1 tRNA (adenosine(37)-N6)-threonylcarbamoyltransferase complex transferase subunit TsaD [[Eubacterium] siraeum]MCM1455345.1 tRNA (adenosine(37)-N6)-threonylcarbamoyltransferase complex transferase subunit TsaD [Bacteroides sp.]
MDICEKEHITILAIESSCDETACAVVRDGRTVLSNVIATQIEIHRRFGGVVPEIASRNHTLAMENVVREAMERANVKKEDIDAIAVTYGAGLLGALLVGVNFAKALAYAWDKPLYAISHVKGHIAGNYIDGSLEPPYLCLLVSGGHTAIVKVEDYEHISLIAQSRDDAVGEAFDKVARVLGLPYPGGPQIQEKARDGKPVYDMPIPKSSGLDDLYFSYSGLKTYVINLVHKMEQKGEELPVCDIAASFQKCAVKQLVDALLLVSKKTGIKKIAIAGGVSANEELRARVDELKDKGLEVHYPKLIYCTDNAAMIASAAYFMIKSGARPRDMSLDAQATVPLK